MGCAKKITGNFNAIMKSAVPASVGAGTALGIDSGPVLIYNGGDPYSW